jgi:hypothetical protein
LLSEVRKGDGGSLLAAASLQPSWLATRYYQLLPPIRELESTLTHALPDNYKQWRDGRDELLAQLISAPPAH